MDVSNRFIVLIIVFACFALKAGDCLKCYWCSSPSDQGCGDSFAANNDLLGDCSMDPPKSFNDTLPKGILNVCIRLNQNKTDGTKMTTRRCGNKVECVGLDTAVCKICEHDACNSAYNIFSPNIIPLYIFAFVTYYVISG